MLAGIRTSSFKGFNQKKNNLFESALGYILKLGTGNRDSFGILQQCSKRVKTKI